MRSSSSPLRDGLISVRAALILTISCISGASAGGLTFLTARSLPETLLAVGTTTGSCICLFNQVISFHCACGSECCEAGRQESDAEDGSNGRA